MRMPEPVAGDGRDAGPGACLPEALVHRVHRDRIPVHADKDKSVRIVKATLE